MREREGKEGAPNENTSAFFLPVSAVIQSHKQVELVRSDLISKEDPTGFFFVNHCLHPTFHLHHVGLFLERPKTEGQCNSTAEFKQGFSK